MDVQEHGEDALLDEILQNTDVCRKISYLRSVMAMRGGEFNPLWATVDGGRPVVLIEQIFRSGSPCFAGMKIVVKCTPVGDDIQWETVGVGKAA